MRSSLVPLGPPVSQDRVITSFPKCYTPAACLQLREHFHGQVSIACQRRSTGTVGEGRTHVQDDGPKTVLESNTHVPRRLRLSKVVVVGDLYVGKTSLIRRFCRNVFDRNYKATIGVDFEIERFEVAGIPYSLQIWDTAGQEKFKCIASAYYRGAQGLKKKQKWNIRCGLSSRGDDTPGNKRHEAPGPALQMAAQATVTTGISFLPHFPSPCRGRAVHRWPVSGPAHTLLQPRASREHALLE
nr:ras-related protein Rab-36 isoform X5 [Vicugna pacos]